ncbi:conserved hypothetical protein [Methylocella tundrae]|uniref:Uncharacterized protein n=1 Tax=Methylocella tundrae TaxID=227605 RepID=A0A8B6MC36_METTU|nr:conserved hypothetical protein [Methylocella tundrae]VTZ52105.1 conserved hypothetical protein [Methylocella tundrae]
MFAAQLGYGDSGLVFLQDRDDLLFAETVPLHSLVLISGQSELQAG